MLESPGFSKSQITESVRSWKNCKAKHSDNERINNEVFNRGKVQVICLLDQKSWIMTLDIDIDMDIDIAVLPIGIMKAKNEKKLNGM